ncbi:MAG TPA: hypothetical protein VKN18_33040 [Blastocatellia bacterium]|nr:hypothetical protein [Blastocatellia bacterium]
MGISRFQYRASLSLLLAITLATFSLSSFAASGAIDNIDETISDSMLVQQVQTGALTTHGPVLVNGNEAKTGATVADGSVVQTRTGGHAHIDLGASGKVELDPITAATLGWTSNSINATLDKCGQGLKLELPAGVSGLIKIANISDVGVLHKDREVDVRVFKGEALVKYGQGKEKIVKAGDHKEFDNATEVTSTGDSIVKVYCLEDHYPLLLWFGLAAIFVPIGELFGGETPPVLSPITP